MTIKVICVAQCTKTNCNKHLKDIDTTKIKGTLSFQNLSNDCKDYSKRELETFPSKFHTT